MSENRTIHLIEIPIGGKGGFTWNRLHSEREDICEALSKNGLDEHNDLLQARLRKIDDALDRLMSGSYGNCSNCGEAIDDKRLDIDPALELCLKCWGRESASDLMLETQTLEWLCLQKSFQSHRALARWGGAHMLRNRFNGFL